MNNEVIQSHC